MLSDGKSADSAASKGEIIEGRYQILKIGNESIEMAYHRRPRPADDSADGTVGVAESVTPKDECGLQRAT